MIKLLLIALSWGSMLLRLAFLLIGGTICSKSCDVWEAFFNIHENTLLRLMFWAILLRFLEITWLNLQLFWDTNYDGSLLTSRLYFFYNEGYVDTLIYFLLYLSSVWRLKYAATRSRSPPRQWNNLKKSSSPFLVHLVRFRISGLVSFWTCYSILLFSYKVFFFFFSRLLIITFILLGFSSQTTSSLCSVYW